MKLWVPRERSYQCRNRKERPQEAFCLRALPMRASLVLSSKEPAYNAGDGGSTPGSGRSLGGGHDNPLQYSCQENPVERGAWWAAVHGVTKGQT